MFQKATLLTVLIGTVSAASTILEVNSKVININGTKAKIISITGSDGTWGYYAKSGQNFDVIVKNNLAESTVLHWHGLELPNDQDGTELTQRVIPAHAEYHYNFKLKNTGTYWLHSHYDLQEAHLAAAPLIIEAPEDAKLQQVVIMFQDFTFNPTEVWTKLNAATPGATMHHAMNMPGMKMNSSTAGMPGMDMSEMKMDSSSAIRGNQALAIPHMKMDLNDVAYNAFLTNFHTPEQAEIKYLKPGKVKLRFINAAFSSNFWINLGKLHGIAVAVDGRPIKAFHDSNYQLSEGQRLDIIVEIPKLGGTFPIIAQVEGLKNQTGLILSTDSNLTQASIPKLAHTAAPALDNSEELKINSSLPWVNKPVNQVLRYTLTGNMSPYVWKINDEVWPNITPAMIKQGDRVELDFVNNSSMSHPLHLHGYGFKVVAVNGKKIDGAIRDTVLVLPQQTVKVQFDATTTGRWFLHCHIGWHMGAGMMTYVEVMPL